MFSYIDQSIRKKLEQDKHLVVMDKNGNAVSATSGGQPYISLLGPIPMPRMIENKEYILNWYVFVRRTELLQVHEIASHVSQGNGEELRSLLQTQMSVNSILAFPGFLEAESPLVRIHSSCMTGDVFGSKRCECGPQFNEAIKTIAQEGDGAIVYMSGHEGRGIGLWAKAVTYLLQDDGQDTYQANISLGLPEDLRDYADAAVVLKYLLQGKPIRLLSNNPNKREQLIVHGQPVRDTVPLVTGICHHNKRYMEAKRQRGHVLPQLLNEGIS